MNDTDAQLDRPAEFEQTIVGRFRGALSDEDRGLMARTFWISDPEALPNLLTGCLPAMKYPRSNIDMT